LIELRLEVIQRDGFLLRRGLGSGLLPGGHASIRSSFSAIEE
jgi:hypothetical protein